MVGDVPAAVRFPLELLIWQCAMCLIKYFPVTCGGVFCFFVFAKSELPVVFSLKKPLCRSPQLLAAAQADASGWILPEQYFSGFPQGNFFSPWFFIMEIKATQCQWVPACCSPHGCPQRRTPTSWVLWVFRTCCFLFQEEKGCGGQDTAQGMWVLGGREATARHIGVPWQLAACK